MPSAIVLLMEQCDVWRLNRSNWWIAMRLVFLRVLSILFSFILFEVAYCLFLFDYNPSSQWFNSLIQVGLPIVAVSQLSFWSIWGSITV